MNDAVLNVRFGKDSLYGIGKAGQVVRTGNEHILYAAVPQTVEHGRPVLSAFVLSDPHSKNILPAAQVDANGNEHSLLYDLPFAADVVMDCIHEHDRINALQRPLLPFPGFGQHFVRDPAHGALGNLDAVDVPDVICLYQEKSLTGVCMLSCSNPREPDAAVESLFP